ncbi:MAG: VTT domain-containing protein [Bacteroidota bacterium]|nr:VTT domain-containing protein [Bacteroidota bacterium]
MHEGIFQQFVEWVIHHGGLYVLLFIIFAETGLFVGFFLPGDSLLFAGGIYIDELASNFFHINYIVLIVLVIVASFTGSMLGYWIGFKTGPAMFQWRDRFLYKKKYLLQAKGFYEKHGKSTIFLSKFLPVVRTFAPLVAGIVQMPRSVFILFNLAGSIAWVSLMIVSGHFLQAMIEKKYGFSLKEHMELITVVIILITTLPVIFKMVAKKKERSNGAITR